MDDRQDAAATDSLGHAINTILPSLERFLRFEGQDPARERSRWRPALDRSLPGAGIGRDATLAELADLVVANGLRVGHPGFSGWVTTMPTDVGAAADLAQAVAVPQRFWASAGNFVDHLAMRWLIELLGFPETCVGTFTAGGSTANLIGIGAARQHAGERLGLRPSLDGIDDMVEPRVYASTETHHVVGRALGVLGMGRRNLRAIPLDRSGTIDLDLLQSALDEDLAAGCTQVAVVGCAGDVNTGRIDPIAELARIAHERGIWLHVDGAYGGFGLLDDRVRERYGDVATYDSFAIDPHKWLAAPVGTGAAIVRDEGILGRAFTIETGDYDRERHVEAGDGDPGSRRGGGWRPRLTVRRAWIRHAGLGCRLLRTGPGSSSLGDPARDRRRRDGPAGRPARRLRPSRGGARSRVERAGAARGAGALDLLLPLPTGGLDR